MDRPFPVRDSTRDTVPVLVPRDRHTAHSNNTIRSTATTSSGPQLHLPPPPTRVTDPDTERAQQALSWSPHQFLGEDEDDDELNPGPVANPFAAVPGLEDCPLAGSRLALSKLSGATNPTSRQTALWTQSRGGTELKIVRTNRIDCTEGTTFRALDLPTTLPLTQIQWQGDNTMRKQQNMLGKTAFALSKGLELMEAPLIEQLTKIADALPDDARARVREEVDTPCVSWPQALTTWRTNVATPSFLT